MSKAKTITILLAVVVILTACGGGGSSSGITSQNTSTSANATSGAAAGYYAGLTSTNYALKSLITGLPNADKYYGFYGTETSSSFTLSGVLIGQGSSGASTFTASSLTDYKANNQPNASASITNAAYLAATTLTGTISESGSTTFTGSGTASTFNTAASLADVTGAWSSTSMDGSAVNLTIASNGFISGTIGTCSISSGSLMVPDTKNFYNVTLISGAGSCVNANSTVTGVAVLYLLPNGVTHELLIGGTSTSNSSKGLGISLSR